MSAWTEVVAEYRAILRQEGRSETTLELTGRWLDRFAAFAVQSGADTVRQVTGKHLAAFQSDLWWQMGAHGQLYSANSRFQCLQMVRAFLRWAHATGRIPKDPSLGLVLRRPPERHDVLTAEEVAKFFAHPVRLNAARDRIVHRLFYHLALERLECAQLDVADVDVAKQTLTVPGPNARTVSLGAELAAMMAQYLADVRPVLVATDDDNALFLASDGHRLSTARYGQIVTNHAKEAGMQAVSLQLWRRTGIAQRFAQGQTLESIQALLGHRHRSNTKRYQPSPGASVQPRPRAAAVPSKPEPGLPFYRRPKEVFRAES